MTLINSVRDLFANLDQVYPSRLAFLRARTLAILAMASCVGVALLLVAALATGGFGSQTPLLIILAGLVALGVLALVAFLALVGYMKVARPLFGVLFLLVGLVVILHQGPLGMGMAVLIVVPLLGSVMMGRRGVLVGTAISLGLVALPLLLEQMGVDLLYTRGPEFDLGLLVLFWYLLGAGLILWLFSANLEVELSLAERTTNQLQAIADISQVATSTMGLSSLLPQLVDLIQDQLGLYHVQIFLLDDRREFAVLRASTGEAGKQLMGRGHRLAVGSRSVIGQTTQRSQTIYATDTSTDPMHRANEFLPGTRSELALPLLDGSRVIGALDVQSTEPNAFSSKDIETLEIMTSLIGVAIRNARLFEQIEASLTENRTLYDQAQTSLREVERLNRQITGQAWLDFLSTSERDYGVTLTGGELQRVANWSPGLAQAVQEGQTLLRQDGDSPVVAVPLDMRGQVVGAIEVTLPPHADPKTAQELIEAVSARLALALDNSRLFEEAQTLAQQEHMINEIGGRLQGVSAVDDILRLALSELTAALGAESAAVRLRSAPLETSG